MMPLGNHIKIYPPEPVVKGVLILEPEPISKARVEKCSSDLPFKKYDTIYFYTNKHIIHSTGIYLSIDMISGYETSN